MQNNYQAVRADFIYTQNPLVYFSNGEIMFTNTFIQNEVLVKPKINFETAFFQLQQKYQLLRLENEELKKELQTHSNNELPTPIPKRTLIRRRQDQLDKKHGCCYQNCKKYYASELALNLHIKIKHKGGTKKQRDDLAKQIILAQMQGKLPPKQLFRLPEGYIEQYKAEHSLQGIKQINSDQ